MEEHRSFLSFWVAASAVTVHGLFVDFFLDPIVPVCVW
jgi:hypothetical protein